MIISYRHLIREAGFRSGIINTAELAGRRESPHKALAKVKVKIIVEDLNF